MLYTLLRNNQIVTGPREWATRYFEYFLKTECEIDTTVPETPVDSALMFDDTTGIFPTYFDAAPVIDEKFEQLAGPKFYFDEIGNYRAQYYALEYDKSVIVQNLKLQIAQARWEWETRPITRIIQGQQLTLYTDRESRTAYIQAFTTADDSYVATWKFPQGFITLNRQDLQLIITEINAHVQDCFNWEAGKNAEIDSKATVAELRDIILIP